ncbi:phospholipid carrier-dependent glycosyltransferase [bacterium]|nr:phospholipid carrier-dependent glycosyltransferase [bacterium]
MNRRSWFLFLLVLSFAFFLRGWRLSFPQEVYFDETFYVPAAESYLQGTQDDNFCHPPLAKIQIAWGMVLGRALGLSEAVGWRFTGLILGVAIVALSYLLAYRLSGGDTSLALLTSFLVSADFMEIVLSRICILDIILAFWTLLGTYFSWLYIEKKEFRWALFSALAFAVSIACKWNGLFCAFTAWLLMSLLGGEVRWQKFVKLALLFVAAWLGVYVLSFGPRFCHSGFTLETCQDIYRDHLRMIEFRYDVQQFNHRYMSQFWSWPLVLRPIWFYYEEYGEGLSKLISGICCLGSPVLWWPGLAFLLELFYSGWQKREAKFIFIGASWLGQWIFWAVSTTGGFIYYVICGVPFISLAMAWVISDWLKSGNKATVITYLTVLSVALVAYYPLLVAIPVPVRWFRLVFPFFLKTWM